MADSTTPNNDTPASAGGGASAVPPYRTQDDEARPYTDSELDAVRGPIITHNPPDDVQRQLLATLDIERKAHQQTISDYERQAHELRAELGGHAPMSGNDRPDGPYVPVPLDEWERLRRLARQVRNAVNLVSDVSAGLHEVLAEIEGQTTASGYVRLLTFVEDLTLDQPRDAFLRPDITQAAMSLAQVLAQRLGVNFISAWPAGPPPDPGTAG